MKCSFCEEETKYHLCRNDEGKINNVNFCKKHARKIEYNKELDILFTKSNEYNNISKFNIIQSSLEKCPYCGMDKYTIYETGILGCNNCFTFFENEINKEFPELYDNLKKYK